MMHFSSSELKEKIKSGNTVIDLRGPDEFASGFIPGSIFFSENILSDTIYPLLDKQSALILVGDKKVSEPISKKFNDSGFEIAGMFSEGIGKWMQAGNPIDMIIEVDTDEFAMDIRFDKSLVVVDLRNAEDYHHSHIHKAINIPLHDLADIAQIAALDEEGCAYFYGINKSEGMVAASWIKKHGLHNLRVLNAGWNDIARDGSIKIEIATKSK